jgi:hypothetical protein
MSSDLIGGYLTIYLNQPIKWADFRLDALLADTMSESAHFKEKTLSHPNLSVKFCPVAYHLRFYLNDCDTVFINTNHAQIKK